MSQPVGPDTRLTFLPLSVVADGGEYLVGHQASGSFVSMPAEGVRVLRELEAGLTVGEAGARLAAQGLEADVADFAEAMLEMGLARVGVAPPPPSPASGWLSLRTASALAAPLFSRPAWAVYGLALVYCLVLLAVRPGYWPTMSDFFIHDSPGLSLAVMLPTSYALLVGHELFHGLAGRAAGVPVRFNVGRRLFMPVLETDLSALLSLPRRQRYAPYLAGMAWDTLVLAASLTLRLLQEAGAIHLSMRGLPAGMALLAVSQLGWQCLVFMRTDLYAVMVTWLGCRNLYRVTYLRIKQWVRSLAAAEKDELEGAAPQDLAVSRWFGWLYLIGLAWAAYYLMAYLLPGLWFTSHWAVTTLTSATPARADFWLALLVGSLTLLETLWPLALYLRERLPAQERRAG